MKNQNNDFAVVGLGEALWDVLPDGKKVGGAPANFAYHVSQFGFEGWAASAVGDDTPGNELRHALESRGLRLDLPSVDYPTGTVQVKLSGNGIPTYEICRNVAWDHIPWTDRLAALARRTRAVSFGSLAQRDAESRRTIRKFIESMPDEKGTLKIFDINLRQDFFDRDIIEKSLELCNVLKINDEEIDIVGEMLGYDTESRTVLARELVSVYHLDILILTCGKDGSFVFTPEISSYVATPDVEVADTVGAGDSFSAGFTAAILSGLDIHRAHQLAADVAAHVCTQHGAMPSLPDAILSVCS